MNNLYPLKFTPICKDKIWGGNKLHDLLNKEFPELPNCGESWEISGVQDDISVVSNGFLTGNSLEELIEVYMGDLVGEKVYEKFGTEFPLLVKFIDANDYLSIQVHPNDELALERHDSFGKTEMWYVVQADPGSRLISGFSRKVDKDEYLHSVENGTLEELLNDEEVKAGDVFFIPAGRVHAIGKGIVVAEIQQTSDVTYRIYDFNRVDDKGNPRELHTDLAVDAIDYSFETNYRTEYQSSDNQSVTLVDCPYFTTNILTLSATVERDFTDRDTFVIYTCLDGDCTLGWEDESLSIKKGDSILVPAQITNFMLSVTTGGNAKLLEVYIK
ncbi:MAG: type I phosphomannose isomerase catalytic subunit [Mariniphaga sp.]